MRTYEVRKKMMIAQYQWGVFRREYDRVKRGYDKWQAHIQERAEKEGLRYFTYDDLYNDYIIGAIDKKTFFLQRKLYNKIVADNWHRAEKLEWLEKNGEQYRQEYEAQKQLYEEALRRDERKDAIKYRNKKNGIKRRTYDFTKRISKYNMPKHLKGQK